MDGPRALAIGLILIVGVGVCDEVEAQIRNRPILRIDRVVAEKPPAVRVYLTDLDSRKIPAGLRSPKSYRLLVDGVPQTGAMRVQSAAKLGEPVTLTFVIQVSPALRDVLNEAVDAIKRTIRALPVGSRVGLVAYTDVVVTETKPADPKEVLARVDDLRIREDAVEVQLLDAIRDALESLTAPSLPPHRMLLVLSDGLNAKINLPDFSALGRTAHEKGIMVNTVGYSPLDPSRQRTLQELSRRGGGTFRRATTAEGVATALAGFQNELGLRPVVQYEVPKFFDGKLHDLQIELPGGKATNIVPVELAKISKPKKKAFWQQSSLFFILLGGGVIIIATLTTLLLVRFRGRDRVEPQYAQYATGDDEDEDEDDDEDDEDDEYDEDDEDDDAPAARRRNLIPSDPHQRIDSFFDSERKPAYDPLAGQDSPVREPSFSPAEVAQQSGPAPRHKSFPVMGQDPSQPLVGLLPPSQSTGPRPPGAHDQSTGPLPHASHGQTTGPRPPGRHGQTTGPRPPRPHGQTTGPRPPARHGQTTGPRPPRAYEQTGPIPGQPSRSAPPITGPITDVRHGVRNPLLSQDSRSTVEVEDPAASAGFAVPLPVPEHLQDAPEGSVQSAGAIQLPDPDDFIRQQVAGSGIPIGEIGEGTVSQPVSQPTAGAQPSGQPMIPLAPALDGPGAGMVQRRTMVMQVEEMIGSIPAWIVMLEGGAPFKTITIHDGFVIGTDPGADLALGDADGRHRCRGMVRADSGGLRIEVTEDSGRWSQPLNDGDTFSLGGKTFLFKSAISEDATSVGVVRLEVLDGMDQGRSIALQEGIAYTIGTHGACDLVIRGEGVGRRHALALKKDAECIVADLGAAAGVVVHGQAVGRKKLSPGDEIKLGEIRLLYVVAEAGFSSGRSPG